MLGALLLGLATTHIVAPVSHFAHPQAKPRTATPAPNVRAGTLLSTDTVSATITVKSRSGATTAYRLTDSTRLYRQKKAAEIGDFQVGESVVIRFKKGAMSPVDLYDLADKPSWDWIDRVRHETTAVTIRQIADGELLAAEGPDSAEVDYRLTANTKWTKAGKESTAGEFKPGDKVHIVPRLMAKSRILALAVSDTAEHAAILKERARTYVTGIVRTIDSEKRLLSLRTVTGDSRDLVLAEECKVRQSGKEAPIVSIRSGQSVTAHLKRSTDGEQVVTSITILSRSPAPTKKPAKSPTTGRDPPFVRP